MLEEHAPPHDQLAEGSLGRARRFRRERRGGYQYGKPATGEAFEGVIVPAPGCQTGVVRSVHVPPP